MCGRFFLTDRPHTCMSYACLHTWQASHNPKTRNSIFTAYSRTTHYTRYGAPKFTNPTCTPYVHTRASHHKWLPYMNRTVSHNPKQLSHTPGSHFNIATSHGPPTHTRVGGEGVWGAGQHEGAALSTKSRAAARALALVAAPRSEILSKSAVFVSIKNDAHMAPLPLRTVSPPLPIIRASIVQSCRRLRAAASPPEVRDYEPQTESLRLIGT